MSNVKQLAPARCTSKLSVADALAGKFPKSWRGEIKEDDCRYLLHIDPLGTGINYLTSRRISVQTGRYVEKQDWCPFIRDYKFSPKLRGYVLDGGIYRPGLKSTDVVSAMRQGGEVFYVCWDILLTQGADLTVNTPQTGRWLSMDENFGLGLFPKWLKKSARQHDPVDLLKKVLAEGGEGIVLKDPLATYGKGWTKVKKMSTFDTIILGYNKPDSEIYAAKGWIGQIICGQIDTSVPDPQKLFNRVSMFEAGAIMKQNSRRYFLKYVAKVKNMTDDLRAKISANPDHYIGKVLELSAQEQLPSGRLRHPSVVGIRTDKPFTDCVLRIGDEA